MLALCTGTDGANPEDPRNCRDAFRVRALRPDHAVLVDDSQAPVDTPFDVFGDGRRAAAAGAAQRPTMPLAHEASAMASLYRFLAFWMAFTVTPRRLAACSIV